MTVPGAALPLERVSALRCGGAVIEIFGVFAHNTPADETFKGAQLPVVFRRDETDGVAHRVRPTRAANAMHVIL